MAQALGYILKLSPIRREVFFDHVDDIFSEPVTEFSHPKNVALVCLIISDDGCITHISRAKSSIRAGTSLKRLNLFKIQKLKFPIEIKKLIEDLPNKFRVVVAARLEKGGLLTPKGFDAVIDVLLDQSDELRAMLARFSSQHRLLVANLPEEKKVALAFQKEALLTALNIAGLPRDSVQDWTLSNDQPESFLEGLPAVVSREDPLIFNDMNNLPGYAHLKTFMSGNAASFQKDDVRLTVVLANRQPLEQQTGTDLIYFNEKYKCFVMVQYKAMEKDDARSAIYRIPNAQLDKEIERMDHLLQLLSVQPKTNLTHSFRLNDNPFFLKLCPRVNLNPDDSSLSVGMYLHLDHWKRLVEDPAIIGAKGGRSVTYKNVMRYFDNTEFTTLVSKAWVGTTVEQSSALEKVIRESLASGKAVTLAMKSEVSLRDESIRGSDLF